MDRAVWTGRSDSGEQGDVRRWHQVVKPWSADAAPGLALLGFACDAGVARNQGRVGAADGPASIRRVLANFAWHGHSASALYDAGDVACADGDLEAVQRACAGRVAALLAARHFPLLLGGGHEIAWASYQGLAARAPIGARIGVINFDAHFDLRALLPGGLGSSGTPFRQIADHMVSRGQPVRYLCLGIARPANTAALYETAQRLGVAWVEDHGCVPERLPDHLGAIRAFIDSVDLLQLSICLDVFPAGLAPGVSAPAGLGVTPGFVLAALQEVLAATRAGGGSKLAVAEIAELNPSLDPAGATARLAARLAFEIAQGVR